MTGAGALTRFALRRSRVLVLAWTAVLTVLCFASAAATGSLYATPADQVAAAESINASSALVALYGPILDVHSTGELAMTKTTVTYAVLVMALAIALVRRHTRVEEESGRAELLGGLALDPRAPLVSAICVGGLVSVLVAALAAARRHRRWPAGRGVAVVRRLVAGARPGRDGSRRRVRPAVRERAHVRCGRGRGRRGAVRAPRRSATRPRRAG